MFDHLSEWGRILGLVLVFLWIIGGLWAALYILDALRQAVPS